MSHAAQGLYDPAFEHDACGLGFVAHIKGVRSHGIVAQALALLDNLSHRGAVGCDPCTGDGSGVLIQLPHYFLARAFGERQVRLGEPGSYGIGMVFLPTDGEARAAAEALIQGVAGEEGLRALGWRDVPVDAAALGEQARRSQPVIRQIALTAQSGAALLEGRALERRLYILRRRIEQAAVPGVYIPSLSARTLVYKGLLRPDQLPGFYPDLGDDDLATGLALVHSRFSTNTFPTWPLAHPYRFICHNGEINTLRGNVVWTRVREEMAASPLFGADMARLFPLVTPGQSDSACFDNVLEFLVAGGMPLAQAMMTMIPEAWDGDAAMDADRRAFYEYQAGVMEPWDGPAAMAFTDGVRIGATLDRNGLRPLRYAVTHDDLVIVSSEAGALPLRPDEVRTKGRLAPGRMLLVDTGKGRIVDDEELKGDVAGRHPYRSWIDDGRSTLDDLPAVDPEPLGDLALQHRLFGYTAEERRLLLAPMSALGEEAVGSMGNDTPLAILAERPPLLFKYFKQLFAQVTNPAIDPIREQLVMSVAVTLGRRRNVLDDAAGVGSHVRHPRPVLDTVELARLRARALTLPMRWHTQGGADGLAAALETLCWEARAAVENGASILILSDRGSSEVWAPIPSLLATAAVHHHLLRERVRGEVSLVVETGEAREVAHMAVLIGYGAAAVNPYVALASVSDGGKYLAALTKGLLKILSKMGISTVQSYCGAQVFEAVGIARDVIDRYFTGTPSRLGGIGLADIAAETVARWTEAADGEYVYRATGEHHAWNPTTIATLQRAARSNDATTYAQFAAAANADAASHTLRGLFELVDASAPVPLDEVEPAASIVRRFSTGAMSFGSLGREAHEALAIAMNRLGGRSNTGEGGEDRARFGTDRSSAIKQVASGRFGVTTEYLVNARELQIKIAQGAKPGEGGQLPGHKVDETIAATRFATPGVTLISPPPHHDIYSIEDLKQLIFDLKNVNPTAAVSVKLVAEAGVGTVAAGVAKAHADRIVIAGDAGGTGASPLSSIKHAGVPWELGLAESHQTLVLNGLRTRVTLETDGQLKTGRDVVLAALLGAEEFGFSTAPLIVEGCIMMRKCHLNTCPVGIATQDPVLRAKFAGSPEHVVNYFFFVAEEVRGLMARLGVRRFDELVGRTDLLRQRASHGKSALLDLAPLLHRPRSTGPQYCTTTQDHGLDDVSVLDRTLLDRARPALERGEPVRLKVPVRTANRAVGAMLSGAIARRHGQEGLPDDTIHVELAGSAGQSFGAFAVRGVTLVLRGEANDYVGKGLSGGRLIITPPRGVRYIPEDTVIIGNTALYGATGGEAFVYGLAGERFAVRNSGAHAVIEGVGDHGCEYMTGGVVVVLGRTGRNFAAGMSGGFAVVYDDDGSFAARCNTGLVALERLDDGESRGLVRSLVERHVEYTNSGRGRHLLRRWSAALPRFVKVMPREYKQVLSRRAEARAHG
jgi:glutamate synthase (NADPH) large chain